MNDYLGNLLARQLERLETVEPRLPSRFEPPAAANASHLARGLFVAEGPDVLEAREGLRPETFETFAPAPDDATHAFPSRRTSPAPPPPRFDVQPPENPAREAGRHTPREADTHRRTPATFEPASSETPQTAEPPRERPARRLEPAEDSSTPARRPEPDAPHAHAGRLTTDEVSAREGRTTTGRPSPREPVGPEGGEPPPRETLHLKPLRPREDERRAAPTTPATPGDATTFAPSSEADARTSPRRAVPPPSRRAGRVERVERVERAGADESRVEHSEVNPSRTPARRERREGSKTEPLTPRREPPHDERRERERQPQPVSLVEPRVTRRAEESAAAQRVDAPQASAPQASAPETTINVTIGRIEIRATPAARPAARRGTSATQPMSLDDYLRRRGGGGGR